jgi:hypothetical protein
MTSTNLDEIDKLNKDIFTKQEKIIQINTVINNNELIYEKNILEKQKKTDRIMSIIGEMTLRRDDHLINHVIHIYKQILVINMKIKEHTKQKKILTDHLHILQKELEYLNIVLNYKIQ